MGKRQGDILLGGVDRPDKKYLHRAVHRYVHRPEGNFDPNLASRRSFPRASENKRRKDHASKKSEHEDGPLHGNVEPHDRNYSTAEVKEYQHHTRRP